jgi:hypothetical protein
MDQRTRKENPPGNDNNPFRKPLVRPDEKEDQADSGPDRDNSVTQESKQRPQRHQAR